MATNPLPKGREPVLDEYIYECIKNPNFYIEILQANPSWAVSDEEFERFWNRRPEVKQCLKDDMAALREYMDRRQ